MKDEEARDVYNEVDEALSTTTMLHVADPMFNEWLRRQRIRHTDLYQTFMTLNTSEVTQDHFVETVIEAALTYGFHAGARFTAEVQAKEST